ncbi:hypothetical protein PPYR_03203 [Photinus pyralis]|uniref:Phospholipid/glycerol acyltransferase domain-containing protein n=1 Tax=Photinus pyralis TaxID=7054 RepID=A0A5N4A246_PHOPY|nr:lysocardiolipin acyltransferase 1-like [Photinus pyralis]KAB0791403.1 hypothetical protein PPYR_03203 [Photinus pyralis]
MGHFKGRVYFILWYSSILAGYAGLFCPLLPILLISNKLYRYLTDVLFTFWQSYPTVLLEVLCGCDVQILGDPIKANETSLLIMNHRTRTDWNFLWPAVFHSTHGFSRYKYPTKFVLKDIIRHIPGIGWVMQLACFLYIKRSWSLDRAKIDEYINYFCEICYKYTLLIFPEGTDFTETTKENSNRYAKKHDLQRYEYVLHPRTTGFVYLAEKLLENNALDALYDLTLVYPDTVPQTERIMFNDGKFPQQVKIHFTRYPASVLPKTSDDLRIFLERRWLEKERVLHEFHVTGHFLHGEILKRTDLTYLYASFVFWTLLPYVVLYCLYEYLYFRYLVVGHTVLMLILNCTTDGFPEVEIVVYKLKKKLFSTPF